MSKKRLTAGGFTRILIRQMRGIGGSVSAGSSPYDRVSRDRDRVTTCSKVRREDPTGVLREPLGGEGKIIINL